MHFHSHHHIYPKMNRNSKSMAILLLLSSFRFEWYKEHLRRCTWEPTTATHARTVLTHFETRFWRGVSDLPSCFWPYLVTRIFFRAEILGQSTEWLPLSIPGLNSQTFFSLWHTNSRTSQKMRLKYCQFCCLVT